MKPEVREFIANARFGRAAVEEVAGMLPEDDAELDSWVAEAVGESNLLAFTLLIFAALSRERPVDARHLAGGGARLVGGPQYMISMALRMQGELPEYLLHGIRNTPIYNYTHAAALLTIAVWCDEHRGGVYPDEMLRDARSLARKVTNVLEVDALLMEVAFRANDSQLDALIRGHYPAGNDEAWKNVVREGRKIANTLLTEYRRPVLETVPQTPIDSAGPNETVRRAVPRTGRNEPCHCGSGKKYKICCYDKDRDRLQQSSDVAGVTRRELTAELERHLTLERLQKLSAADICRLDPAEIPRHLLVELFVRLALSDVDRAAASLEKLGYADDLEDGWFFVLYAAVRAGRKDIGERMLKLREPFGYTEDQMRLNQRLLLAQDDPAKCIQLIEEAAQAALKSNDKDELSEIAYAVAFSKFSALGILLYRGVLPFLKPETAEQSYEQMLIIRDRLSLPTDDPIHSMLPTFIRDADDSEAALKEAEEKFEAKRREVRGLKESLDQLQKELARRERVALQDSHSPVIVSSTGENDPKLNDLRDKVKRLETDLKERHDERNALQRRLEDAQTKVEALRERAQTAAAEGSNAEADHEDDLLLPQDAEGNHPLRLIEFPRNFHERLNEFPHHVARSAMAALGRLAGGDSAAFSGAKRLKSRPNVVRQRIGIDFRLLFRLLPDRIQVIDLIPRQDMERRIKTL